MPSHYLYHLLNLHPRYAHQHRRLSNMHHHHNPKKHGHALVHHHKEPERVQETEGGGVVHSKHRRPKPLKFLL